MKRGRASSRGFSLLEALLALLLASILFGGISLYTGTWLKRWQGLVLRGGHEDMIAVVLDRIVEDLEAAQPIFVTESFGRHVSFDGRADSVTFLRPALGYEARAGLDRITYMTGSVSGSPALLRLRRGFGPGPQGGGGEDLPLMRGAFGLAFAFAGDDGAFLTEWNSQTRLPGMVRVEITGEGADRARQYGFARMRVVMPAYCGTPQTLAGCIEQAGF